MRIDRRLALPAGGLILALAIGTSSLWGYYHHSPSARCLRELSRQVVDGKGLLDQLAQVEIPERRLFVDRLSEISRSFETIKQLADELEQMFPPEQRLGQLLDLLSRTAESDGVRVLRIEPGKLIEKDQWQEIPLELQFVCGLEELQTFLTSVERMPRFVRINSFSITLEGEDHLQLEGQMECSAFVVKMGG